MSNHQTKIIAKTLLALACAAVLALSACAKNKDKDSIARLSQQQLVQSFENGVENLRRKKYKKAAQSLAVIAHDHPYSSLAPRAQLLLAYAYYRRNRKIEALVEAESFILAYPASPSLAYALYLKGLIYFQNVQHVERTQEDMQQARIAFEALQEKFPRSPYANDAKSKLNLVATQLVAHDMQNARFYLKHKKPLAAADLLIKILVEYPNTLYTAEVLYRLVEASLSLGMVEEAIIWQDFLAVNYPDESWSEKADKRVKKSSTPERIKIITKNPANAPSPAALPPKQTQ